MQHDYATVLETRVKALRADFEDFGFKPDISFIANPVNCTTIGVIEFRPNLEVIKSAVKAIPDVEPKHLISLSACDYNREESLRRKLQTQWCCQIGEKVFNPLVWTRTQFVGFAVSEFFGVRLDIVERLPMLIQAVSAFCETMEDEIEQQQSQYLLRRLVGAGWVTFDEVQHRVDADLQYRRACLNTKEETTRQFLGSLNTDDQEVAV